MRSLIILLILATCQSCSLFHAQQQFEVERLSQDVLNSKASEGIQIEITKIPIGAK